MQGVPRQSDGFSVGRVEACAFGDKRWGGQGGRCGQTECFSAAGRFEQGFVGVDRDRCAACLRGREKTWAYLKRACDVVVDPGVERENLGFGEGEQPLGQGDVGEGFVGDGGFERRRRTIVCGERVVGNGDVDAVPIDMDVRAGFVASNHDTGGGFDGATLPDFEFVAAGGDVFDIGFIDPDRHTDFSEPGQPIAVAMGRLFVVDEGVDFPALRRFVDDTQYDEALGRVSFPQLQGFFLDGLEVSTGSG